MKNLIRRWVIAVYVVAAMCGISHAQNQGEPGKFDFFVMNISSAADFCSVPGAGADCKTPGRFVLHGLWPQNNDGSYPVNCGTAPGPAKREKNLDLTPDLMLLQHEWDKHGTCTTLSPDAFFAAERKVYTAFRLPPYLLRTGDTMPMETEKILSELGRINPGFPAGSILLSCKNERLTAVEACVTKNLKPMVCKGLSSCAAKTLTIAPPAAR